MRVHTEDLVRSMVSLRFCVRITSEKFYEMRCWPGTLYFKKTLLGGSILLLLFGKNYTHMTYLKDVFIVKTPR